MITTCWFGPTTNRTMVDIQWQDGKRVILWPPEAQTGKLYYPMPTFAEKATGNWQCRDSEVCVGDSRAVGTIEACHQAA